MHRRRCLVGEQPLRSSQSLVNVIAQGTQIPGCPTNPVRQGGSVELDALPGIYLRLPVQRQMIGVLGNQHLCDQSFGWDASLDDLHWHRGLHDRALAQTAAVSGAARGNDA